VGADGGGVGALAWARWAGWVLERLVVVPLVVVPLVTAPFCASEGLCVSVSSCDSIVSRPDWCIMCM
jgi:hypothetical protein